MDQNSSNDISGEVRRHYTFPNGQVVTVEAPARLWVKAPPAGSTGGGSHRIALANGNGVYIPSGWVKIEWENKPGVPAVSF